jgi:hypothetical protein
LLYFPLLKMKYNVLRIAYVALIKEYNWKKNWFNKYNIHLEKNIQNKLKNLISQHDVPFAK